MPKGDKELLNEIKGLKQRYRAFVDDAPDGIIEVGRNGVVLYANRKALKIAGRAKGNFIGKSLASLMPSESVFRELRDLQKVFRGKTLEDYSFEIADKKGKIRGVVANINPVKDGTKITGAQIILRCAPALGTAEAKCAGLLENANDLIQSVNSEGKFIYVNKKWKELLGYSDAEVKKLGLMDIIRKDQRAHCKEMFGKVMRGKTLTAVETVFVGKRGNEVHVEGNVTPHMENGKFVSTMAIFRDVSGRKTAEAGLKESEIKFREIFELSPEAIVAISPNGKIIEVNKRIYDWLGYKPEEIKGLHLLKLPFIPAKSKAIMIKNFGRRMLGKDFPPYELEFKAKGGK
ncbi:PAS domain S-box protein, partial [Candidatus Micrarchaeota archaeon]|nr:PAS domain S-box protein [Candidatus Micrarchaeota archaeon]MBU1939189.1 PAS domain S-box protein [Candidatus Micrarchaeota archaeon]